MTKHELRIEYRDIRNKIKLREEKSELISRNLIRSDIFTNCKEIFLYFPIGSEVATQTIFEESIKRGKKVAFPKCIDVNGNMKFCFVNSFDELKEGMYGIYEPDLYVSDTAIPKSDSLIIVPALAFDIEGYRLGYGKGYYDKYLSGYPCKTAGLAFDECVCHKLPHEIFDKKIDFLFTDKEIYCFE